METESLYRPAEPDAEVRLTAIPYYAWDHRQPGEMVVWIPETTALAEAKLPPTLAREAQASASHANPPDSLAALSDGILPASSGDPQIPRFTWWDHCGTEEWVQYTFPEPHRLSCVEVYWFDDTGAGSCRVPASWAVQWLDGDTWRDVTGATAYGVNLNGLNRVAFDPVRTQAVRLLVQLREGFSGGVLEWRLPGS
jgi:hypothetical protein